MDSKKNNNQMEDDGDNKLSQFKRIQVDHKKIQETLPGLNTYKNKTKKEIQKYYESNDPKNLDNNILIFVFLLINVIFNMYFVIIQKWESQNTSYQVSVFLESMLLQKAAYQFMTQTGTDDS